MRVSIAVAARVGRGIRVACAFLACASIAQAQARRVPVPQPRVRVVAVDPTFIIPSTVLTVSFDRPLAEEMEKLPNPARVLRLSPAINARFEWRSPTTLRVIPRTRFASGATYQLSVDTTIRVLNGARLAAYTRTLRVAWPRIVTVSFRERGDSLLPVNGHVVLRTTDWVDTAKLNARVYAVILETAKCAAVRIPYRLVSQREVRNDDYRRMRTQSDTMLNAIEYAPLTPLPFGCRGELHIPEFGANGVLPAVFSFKSAPPFQIADERCIERWDCTTTSSVRLAFTAPIAPSQFRKYVRVEPQSALRLDSVNTAGLAWIIPAKLEHGTRIRIIVDPALTDIHGRKYAGARELNGLVQDAPPFLRHAQGQLIASRASRPTLKVMHRNIDSVTLIAVRLSDTAALHILQDPLRDRFQRGAKVQGDTFSVVHVLSGPWNVINTSELPLPFDTLQPSTALWKFQLVSRARSRADTTQPLYLQFSDLGVFARFGGATPAAFVTNSTNGVPVQGATVRWIGRDRMTKATSQTAADGVALTDASKIVPAADILEVTHDRDRVWLLPSIEYSAAGSARAYPASPRFAIDAVSDRVVLWAERAIYRPGETVHFGAALRESPGFVTTERVRRDSLRFTLIDGNERQVSARAASPGNPSRSAYLLNRVLSVSATGLVDDSVVLPISISTGDLYLKADVFRNGKWNTMGMTNLKVAEYRLPEFVVTVDTPTAPMVASDTGIVRVRATYLHGAPMSGATVRTAFAIRYADSYRTPNLPKGFALGQPESWNNAGLRQPVVNTLDSAGALDIPFSMTTGSVDGPQRVDITTTVVDVNRQQVTTRNSFVLHPSEFYLAAKFSTYQAAVDESVHIPVLAVAPDGMVLPRRRFELLVTRTLEVSVEDGINGGFRHIDRIDTISRNPYTSADSAIDIVFTPNGIGRWGLQLRAVDDHGRKVVSGYQMYVTPNRPVTAVTGLRVTTSRELYKLGDTAIVSFDSPFTTAEAWITLERNGVLKSLRSVVRQGANHFAIPVTHREAPNVYVGVSLVPSGVAWARTGAATERAVQGYATLIVDMSSRRLAVTMATDRQTYKPGDSIHVALQVRDARGAPASSEAVVWAVDEANLLLREYRAPDLFSALHSPVSAVTSAWTTAARVMDSVSFLRDVYGNKVSMATVNVQAMLAPLIERGQTGYRVTAEQIQSLPVSAIAGVLRLSDEQVRAIFETAAFFQRVTVNEMGQASINAKLPDNLTKFRLFAIALDTTNRAGSAETTFSITKALVARAALPRFMRAGDSLFAGGVVSTTDGSTRSGQLLVRASGMQLLGDSTRNATFSTLPLDARFNWRVGDVDTVKMELRAGDGTASDGVRAVVPVKPVARPRYIALAGIVREPRQLRISLPATTNIAHSTVTLRVGNSPLPMLQLAAKSAGTAEFDGSEQLASSLRISTSILTLQRKGVQVVGDTATLRNDIIRLSGMLTSRVSANGDVSYWPVSTWTTPWLTGYVTLALLDVRAAGFDVDSATLARLRKRNAVTKMEADSVYGLKAQRTASVQRARGEALLTSWIAHRFGDASSVRDSALFATRRSLTWEDRAWLAELLQARGRNAMARVVLRELWSDVHPAGRMMDIPDLFSTIDYPSRVRPPARLLAATAAAWPTHPMLPQLFERVLSRGASRGMYEWNSQDHAWMVSAIATWMQNTSDATTHVHAAGGTAPDIDLVASASSVSDTLLPLAPYVRLVGDSLIFNLNISADSGGAYYAVEIGQLESGRATVPDRHGLVVDRWYERYSDGTPVTDVKEGELVRIRLRVTAPTARDFVALEDWLPSGLEVVDPSLRTSASLAALTDLAALAATRRSYDTSDAEDAESPFAFWYGPWEYRELRDDRVRWYARSLWAGSYTVSYIVRATAAGKFVRAPAYAEEMYNRGVNGRSDGGWFLVRSK